MRDDDLRTGSYRNQIESRHRDFAKRYGETVADGAGFMYLDQGARARIAEVVRLAVLDGALRELELRFG